MPLIPEEPQIHESAQGPRVTPAAGRSAQTPRPVPGPRPVAPPRPGRPGPLRPTPPAQRTPRDTAPAAPAAVQIQLIPASADGALDAAEEALDLLLESGRAPGDVLVVTTGAQHPWTAHELSFGEASYWAQHDARDDVFYTDAALASRAAQRPVVVVAVNGGPDDSAALLLARSKAGALVIACGDPQRIGSVLGAGV
ncbi:hypothetical protein IAG44_10140 [Streptomyces roseirectus]|uniref:Uncharacterized protein n=1 Tax=Streptomyces roseirectus TaxID=2768066 RepID=A0A7H0IAF6_9ACTN|nr:hypothetical protein [Streptomyces roseirectus]QNP69772.1 hypothetical protein IAG44_10140 [Streptomyces roseirectus]